MAGMQMKWTTKFKDNGMYKDSPISRFLVIDDKKIIIVLRFLKTKK